MVEHASCKLNKISLFSSIGTPNVSAPSCKTNSSNFKWQNNRERQTHVKIKTSYDSWNLMSSKEDIPVESKIGRCRRDCDPGETGR